MLPILALCSAWVPSVFHATGCSTASEILMQDLCASSAPVLKNMCGQVSTGKFLLTDSVFWTDRTRCNKEMQVPLSLPHLHPNALLLLHKRLSIRLQKAISVCGGDGQGAGQVSIHISIWKGIKNCFSNSLCTAIVHTLFLEAGWYLTPWNSSLLAFSPARNAIIWFWAVHETQLFFRLHEIARSDERTLVKICVQLWKLRAVCSMNDVVKRDINRTSSAQNNGWITCRDLIAWVAACTYGMRQCARQAMCEIQWTSIAWLTYKTASRLHSTPQSNIINYISCVIRFNPTRPSMNLLLRHNEHFDETKFRYGVSHAVSSIK